MRVFQTDVNQGVSAFLFATSVGLFAFGCVKQDYPAGRDVISEVELQNGDAVDSDDVLEGLATTETPLFLNLFEGIVYDYELFDETLLERDLKRIERYYRARGYYAAKVSAARVVRLDERHVRVEIVVEEGKPVLMQSEPSWQGLAQLPVDVAAKIVSAVELKKDQPFDEDLFEGSKTALQNVLADHGYAFAKVDADAHVDIAQFRADVVFKITPGPVSEYGQITIVGLQEIPENRVRKNLLIKQGERYSRADLQDAQDALVNLGVFSSVEIRQDKTNPQAAKVPLTVVVQESTLRTLTLGVGGNADVLRVSAHLRIGWEDRNFLGGLRRFSIDTRPGLNFYPMRIDNLVMPTRLIPENRLSAELRQPSFIEGRTTGFIASEYNVYPLLFVSEEPEAARIIGYNEVTAATGVERAFFGHHLFATPSYNWEARFPFYFQGQPVAGLERVIVSYPELLLSLDFRDDPIEPHKGFFLSNSVQVAGYIFSGNVSDIRVQPEARAYLPVLRSVTLALRATFGFLFPDDYGDTRTQQMVSDADRNRDQHKLLLRAFFSGGPGSNRGYAFRGVGPQGFIGFLLPTGVDCALEPTPDACTLPIGGLTLWEASVELRFPITESFRGVLFADASDVGEQRGELRFSEPHLSLGPGLRLLTPVGPLRVDFGYRVPSLQVLGVSGDVPKDEGQRTTFLGLPAALHVAIGEAF